MTTTESELRRAAAGVLLASFAGPVVPDWLRRRVDDGLGGVCLFAGNLAAGAAPIADILHRTRDDLVVAVDEEGGDVTRLEAGTGSSVPGAAALGAVDDVDLTCALARALGEELAAGGIDVDLAPVADVNTDAANPVIGVRSFGADADLVARHTAAFVAGLQSAGVTACAKHFPGHGATRVDSHLALPVIDATVDLLRRRELVPFRAAIAAGTRAVMAGHLVVPAFDDEPATTSPRLLGDVLRGELGFEGAVLTDALDMAGSGGVATIPATVVRAVAAGADLCCLGPAASDDAIGAAIDGVVAAVTDGTLPEARLVDAATRVPGLRRARPDHEGRRRDAVDWTLAALGVEAATRAVRIEGELVLPVRGAHVVELGRPSMIAAGDLPWGIALPLHALDATTTSERPPIGDGNAIDASLARASGRPLVVVVRDPQRDERQSAALRRLVVSRPDAIVVDLGWPAPAPARLGCAVRIITHSGSRASGEAVARLLAGLPVAPAPGGTGG